jgi:hypothetical protein
MKTLLSSTVSLLSNVAQSTSEFISNTAQLAIASVSTTENRENHEEKASQNYTWWEAPFKVILYAAPTAFSLCTYPYLYGLSQIPRGRLPDRVITVPFTVLSASSVIFSAPVAIIALVGGLGSPLSWPALCAYLLLGQSVVVKYIGERIIADRRNEHQALLDIGIWNPGNNGVIDPMPLIAVPGQNV